ncbi:MAG: hypothetical protein WC919_00135 [Candidatus Paceibacterota bacterium]|jgi:hypothetical protein
MQAADFAPIHPNPQIQAGLEAMRRTMTTTSMPEIKLFDIVQLYGGRQQMVVVDIKPNRPANPFVGVLVKGQGAQYKFGPKHRPNVVGHANPDHPALIAMRQRKGMTTPQVEPVNQEARAVFFHLLDAVEAGDMAKAKILAAAIRTMPGYGKN